MDSILKKTMFEEIDSCFEQIEEIVAKYNMSDNIVYIGCVGVVEEAEEDIHEWQVKYTWNIKDTNELEEVVQLQVEAFLKSQPEDPLDILFLN